jgi:hypothetical protein
MNLNWFPRIWTQTPSKVGCNCKEHDMWLVIYELLNPCHFTHLIARDNDMTFNYRDHLYYLWTFSYFVIILKFQVINFHGVSCKGCGCHVNLIICLIGCYKKCRHVNVTCVKNCSHTTNSELGVKFTCELFIGF